VSWSANSVENALDPGDENNRALLSSGGPVMEGDMSSEELLEQACRAMGPELGSVYHALKSELVRLHIKWRQYRLLYAESPGRIELLNQAASHLFGILQEVLLEDVVLHIARLSDSEKSVGKENLSFRRLPSLINDKELVVEVGALVNSALAACGFARDWRNRRLAHRDLALALASAKDPLPGISRADIEAAMLSIRTLLNRLSGHYIDSEVLYQLLITNGGGADSLVYYLQQGLRSQEKRRERLEKGRFLPEDLER
jgi:hypothetical protein